jgi:hypothetical protein
LRLNLPIFGLLAIIMFSLACKKETAVFEDNEIPPYDGITTLLVENYVNRTYIDLLGREPLDIEMESDVAYLEENGLSFSARGALVDKLMTNTDPLDGDISYNHAYHHKIYEDTKARLIEGASDAYIQNEIGILEFAAQVDSVNGNWEGYQAALVLIDRLESIIDSKEDYRTGIITIDEMYRRMLYNTIYDFINMNSFNFVNASFDDLYYRFPTKSEFDNAFEIIEFNQPATIFGLVAQNKSEYVDILTTVDEYEEGMIRWVYLSLLAREPNSLEVFTHMGPFQASYDVQEVQKAVIISDEYAGFD